MTNAPTPAEMSKGKATTQTIPQKISITQRLRTDLGRSVGVTHAIQLVWLGLYPTSVRNRCVIEVFGSVFYVVTLLFGLSCGCRGFCHRTESDMFHFLLVFGWYLSIKPWLFNCCTSAVDIILYTLINWCNLSCDLIYYECLSNIFGTNNCSWDWINTQNRVCIDIL